MSWVNGHLDINSWFAEFHVNLDRVADRNTHYFPLLIQKLYLKNKDKHIGTAESRYPELINTAIKCAFVTLNYLIITQCTSVFLNIFFL
jgi:hypothetical protein